MTDAQTETTKVSYKTMHEEVQTENAQLLRLLKNNREANSDD